MTGSKLPILFIGESWLGSCARSLREALVRSGEPVEEISSDTVFPKWRSRFLRAALRLGAPLVTRDFRGLALEKLEQMAPALVLIYKGSQVGKDLVNEMRQQGSYVVNIYPDCSPLAQGQTLREALAVYDLVVSTKPWHLDAWHKVFGYTNRCEFIPQGYDPGLHYHLVEESNPQPIDVLLVATYRVEYGDLILALARIPAMRALRLELHGHGWRSVLNALPPSWRVGREAHGHAYWRLVSLAKVCIAPVTREVVVDGKRYPGDEDTTRTYELPAMGAFFIHRRTPYVQNLFKENSEVLMYDDASELAEHILWALKNPGPRLSMRKAAQRRSVPRDSVDQRAKALLQLLGGIR